MSWLFGNDKDTCPIEESQRQWIDNALLWLLKAFGEENIIAKKMLTPSFEDFPIKFNGEHQTTIDTCNIIASQMDINPADISLDIYEEGREEISTGSPTGVRIFMQNDNAGKSTSGLYWGKQEDGKYHVALEEKNLSQPEKMIATLSHELSHIKLLGEGRIEKNNEPLTDLTTVVFGLGVFNANAAFQFRNNRDSWGYSKLGYLSQMEWGYALALLSHLKKEENPKWAEYLDRSVKADFKQSTRFILKNPDLLFQKSKG